MHFKANNFLKAEKKHLKQIRNTFILFFFFLCDTHVMKFILEFNLRKKTNDLHILTHEIRDILNANLKQKEFRIRDF